MRLSAGWIGIFASLTLAVFCASAMLDRSPIDPSPGAAGSAEPVAGPADPSTSVSIVGPTARALRAADGAADRRADGSAATSAPSEVVPAARLLVSGRVVDSRTSAGVGGALVNFDGGEQLEDVVVSAEDGTYSISIPVECTGLTVSHVRYQPQSWAPPRSFAVDRSTLSHDFALEVNSMTAPLRIRARSADGRPAAEASFDVVALTQLAIPLDRIAASTDASAYLAQLGATAGSVGVFESIDGEFPTRLDPSGEATILVLAPIRVGVSVETDDAVGIAEVDVRCEPATVDVVLQPTWDLAIELREFSGPAPASFCIQVDGSDVAAEHDAGWLYRVRGLARSSDVRIPVRTVFDRELRAWLVPSVRAVRPPDEGRERRIELRIDEIVARSVSGTIRDAVTDEPVNARIAIRCAGALPIPDEYAIEGRFTARMVPGAVLLVLADGYEPAFSKWPGSVDVLEPIGLVPRATRSDRTRRGALRGVVHGIGGASLEDAVEIEYSAIADTWRDRTTAARDGSFAFDGLPLGDAFVLARSGDSFARVTVRVDGPAMPALALELRPQAEVRLQVVDALDGTDIDGVWTIDHGPAAFSDRVELVCGASVPIVVGAFGYATRHLALDGSSAVDGRIRVELTRVP